MQTQTRGVITAVRAAALLSVTLTAGCAVFTPPHPETARAMEAYGRWSSAGARPAATMQDMIELGMVNRPEPCEPLQPSCVVTPGSVAQVPAASPVVAKPILPMRTARAERRVLGE
jgi:hypothetical protein